MILIVDYGVGNLYSLQKAFRRCGADAGVSENAEDIRNADALVLPGVGSFEAGMRGLKVRNLIEPVKLFAHSGKPVLGICLGAQLLLSKGFEFGEFDGLGIIPGSVKRFPDLPRETKIPHIGWNHILLPAADVWNKTILDNIPEDSTTYFVHSYVLNPEKPEHWFTKTIYGGYEFCSAVRKGNIYGTQFHPEKSGAVGLKIIQNFVTLK